MTFPRAQMNVQILLFGKVRVFAAAIFLGDLYQVFLRGELLAGGPLS